MAIALGNGFYGGFTVGTSHTFSHTVEASPADPFLFVAVQGDNVSDTLTGVTYAGAAMTLVQKVQRAANRWCYIFYKAAPATGANNVVISGASAFYQGFSASYTGVDQTNPVDTNPSTNTTASATSLTQTVNVVASNCWLASFGQVDSGGAQGPVSAGTGATRRANDTSFSSAAIFDSAGTVSTGNQTIQHTWANLGGGVGVAFAMVPSSGGGATPAVHRNHMAVLGVS